MGFSHLGVGALMVPHLGGVVPWYRAGGAPAPVGAYQAKGAASYAASLVNLANPGTNDLTEGNGEVTWSGAAGWQLVAAGAKYFSTGLVNASGWSMIVQFASVTTGYVAGAYSGNSTRLVIQPTGVGYMNGGNLTVAPALPTGSLAVAGQQGYRNGAADGGAIGAWSGTATRAIYIGCYNNQGTAATFLTGNIYAIAIYNLTLAPSQVLAIATAMAAL